MKGIQTITEGGRRQLTVPALGAGEGEGAHTRADREAEADNPACSSRPKAVAGSPSWTGRMGSSWGGFLNVGGWSSGEHEGARTGVRAEYSGGFLSHMCTSMLSLSLSPPSTLPQGLPLPSFGINSLGLLGDQHLRIRELMRRFGPQRP